jgi:hypothetical protein
MEKLFETNFSKVEQTNTALQEQSAIILKLLQDQQSRTGAVDDQISQDGVLYHVVTKAVKLR